MSLDAQSYLSQRQLKVIPFLPVSRIWSPLLSRPSVPHVQGFPSKSSNITVSQYLSDQVKPNPFIQQFQQTRFAAKCFTTQQKANIYHKYVKFVLLILRTVSSLKLMLLKLKMKLLHSYFCMWSFELHSVLISIFIWNSFLFCDFVQFQRIFIDLLTTALRSQDEWNG